MLSFDYELLTLFLDVVVPESKGIAMKVGTFNNTYAFSHIEIIIKSCSELIWS